eukprot:4027947-Pyramimonas_sp.AAC.1
MKARSGRRRRRGRRHDDGGDEEEIGARTTTRRPTTDEEEDLRPAATSIAEAGQCICTNRGRIQVAHLEPRLRAVGRDRPRTPVDRGEV